MIGPVAAAAALALAAPGLPLLSAEPEWRLASADGDSATFIDHRSRLRAGDTVRFWSTSVLRRPGRRLNGIRVLIEADCRKFTYRPLTTMIMLGATPLLSGPGRKSTARPGRDGYEMVRAGCGLKPPGAVSADPEKDMAVFWAKEAG
jgi:hypothetical protein